MRELRENRSGQALILAALAIALIISSTVVYVYEASQVSDLEYPCSPAGFTRVAKMGSMNLMVGSLANISHGGSNQTLETNLERWCSFIENHYYPGKCDLSFELCEVFPYASGLWMFWGEDGFGETSAKADFSTNLTEKGVEVSVAYAVNVTTSISIRAVSRWESNTHFINVTISVSNEGRAALAKNFTVYYEEKKPDRWVNAGLLASYRLQDYGNGTYVASFQVGPPRTEDRRILAYCYDQREIFVRATTTCEDV